MLYYLTGRVAQLVERQSNKLPVEGSSPFVTTFCTAWFKGPQDVALFELNKWNQ